MDNYPHTEPLESFFGISEDRDVSLDFELLLREGYAEMKGLPETSLFLDNHREGLAKNLNLIVQRAIEDEGWVPLLFELALIEDARHVGAQPRFMSIISCSLKNARDVLASYSSAMDLMSTVEAHAAPIVPAATTYTVPYVYIPSQSEPLLPPKKRSNPGVETMLRFYDYYPDRGDREPTEQVATLWKAFMRHLAQRDSAKFTNASFLAIPFIRPRYAPADLNVRKTGSPGGVFFCAAESREGGASHRHLAMKISGMLHRSAAQYAISRTEANDRQLALLEQVGHELKSIVTELNWQRTLANVVDDKTIAQGLRQELTLLISRMWMPHAIGTAMRSSKGQAVDTETLREWLNPVSGPPDYESFQADYKASVIHLAKFLSNSYADKNMTVYWGSPFGNHSKIKFTDCFELDPFELRFPPLRIRKDLDFQPTLYAAAIIAEPIRNALKHSFSANDKPAAIFIESRVTTGNESALISVWNKRKPNEKVFMPTGNAIVKTLSNSVKLGDVACIDDGGWWRVDITLHPHKLGAGEGSE
jgi:hypothetical protein